VLAFSTVAATEENQGFLRSFPFLNIAYTLRAVIFGHVLASWNPKSLGATNGSTAQMVSVLLAIVLSPPRV